jgi:hypothetical protein
VPAREPKSVDQVLEIDRESRRAAHGLVQRRSRKLVGA